MRAFLLLTALAALPALAKPKAPAEKFSRPSDIRISTEFEYADLSRKTAASTAAIFDRANHDWKTISSLSGGIILQARVVSSSPKDVRVEYQVLDAKNNNAVLASPAFLALFGEKTSMESSHNGAKTKISLVAKPVK